MEKKYCMIILICSLLALYTIMQSLQGDNDAVHAVPHSYFDSKSEEISSFMNLKNLEHFFDYLDVTEKLCFDLRKVGGHLIREEYSDGDKKVCYDSSLRVNDKNNCKVLSFGINYEWSFDDSIGETGCQVFSFDPFMNKPDHKRSQNVTFFNFGISNINGFLGGNKRLKVFTYKDILARLNLTDSVISYLKMDVEGSEIQFFSDLFTTSPHLLSNIEQIGMEIHTDRLKNSHDENAPPRLFSTFWKYFQKLEKFGFRLVKGDMNEASGNHYKYKDIKRSVTYELLWVKVEFLST